MREYSRFVLLLVCCLFLGVCSSSAQSVGESDPPTATPTATPTPTPVPCELYSLRIWEPCERTDSTGYCIDYLMSGGAADGRRNATIDLTTSGTANQESCILNTLINGFQINAADRTNSITFNAEAELSDNSYSFSGAYDDYKYRPDWVARTFWTTIQSKAGLSNAPYQTIRNNYINCLAWADQRTDRYAEGQGHKGDEYGLGGGEDPATEPTCHDGTVYFRAGDCALMPLSAATSPGCSTKGSLSIKWLRGTPISLIFNARSNPLGTSTIVSFPLEPGQSGARWEWRGSSDAPVLVYDPEHKGRITSAHQLFGPWAFGGKRVASLERAPARAWSSGFEALAQLDNDHDGEIRGVELEPLGLWFDENRDAISQPGEVRSSKDVGIVRLKVAFDKTDSKTGDIISSIGYDRLVDGKVVSGPTVDWVAHGASSARDLAIDAALNSSLGAGEAKGEFAIPSDSGDNNTSPPTIDEVAKIAGRKAHEVVAGAWAVRLEDMEPQDGLSGVLVFNGGETSELAGISLVELDNRTAAGSSRLVRFTVLKGTIDQNKDSTFALSFVSKSEGAKLENTATIDTGGKLMQGSTVATRADGTQLRYKWTAKPVPLGLGRQKPERAAEGK